MGMGWGLICSGKSRPVGWGWGGVSSVVVSQGQWDGICYSRSAKSWMDGCCMSRNYYQWGGVYHAYIAWGSSISRTRRGSYPGGLRLILLILKGAEFPLDV